MIKFLLIISYKMLTSNHVDESVTKIVLKKKKKVVSSTYILYSKIYCDEIDYLYNFFFGHPALTVCLKLYCFDVHDQRRFKLSVHLSK